VAARVVIPVLALLAMLAGCAANPERPAASSVGCAQSVVAGLPPGLDDAEKHCLASAGIARGCSTFEAWLAGMGKEVGDLFDDGDASMEDLHANALGRRCAASPGGPDALLECCRLGLAGAAR
jgi:hypothetical protein